MVDIDVNVLHLSSCSTSFSQEQQMERMRVIHALRNVPASRPGEPHHRSQEQLALLAKLVRTGARGEMMGKKMEKGGDISSNVSSNGCYMMLQWE